MSNASSRPSRATSSARRRKPTEPGTCRITIAAISAARMLPASSMPSQVGKLPCGFGLNTTMPAGPAAYFAGQAFCSSSVALAMSIPGKM